VSKDHSKWRVVISYSADNEAEARLQIYKLEQLKDGKEAEGVPTKTVVSVMYVPNFTSTISSGIIFWQIHRVDKCIQGWLQVKAIIPTALSIFRDKLSAC
jgi:hypothetical protein